MLRRPIEPLLWRCCMTFAALLLVGVLAGCNDAPKPEATRAFYYWRSTLELSGGERQALRDLHADRVYLRAFDVVADDAGAARFVGELRVREASLPRALHVVPVVFLRNQVFARLTPPQTRELAARVWQRVLALWQPLALPDGNAAIAELQVDCDWTDTTRERFFEFVKALRAVGPPGLKLSSTIRLHQVKFRERTGVPPVERGMLMFYNMGQFSSKAEDRAIFDANIAARYLERVGEYPLPLDVALPIWSWTLQLRGERVVGLLQSTDPAELQELDFLRAVEPSADGNGSTNELAPSLPSQRYEVLRTTFLHGALLRQGDVLKGETLTAADLQTAGDLLAEHLSPDEAPRTVALFDLSDKNLERHHVANLDHAFRMLR